MITQTDIENLANMQAKKPKIYREKAVWGGTFLGGPLVAGYIFFVNYKAFGEPEKAKRSLTIGIFATLLIFGLGYLMKDVPRSAMRLVPFAYTAIASGLIYYLQGKQIQEHEKSGGQFFSGWRVAGIGLLSCIAMLAIFFTFILNFRDFDPNWGVKSKTYGSPPCSIYYRPDNMTVPEIDGLEIFLNKDGAFAAGNSLDVFAEKNGKELVVTYTVADGTENDQQAIASFEQLRNTLQRQYPDKNIVIKLSGGGTFDDVKKTLK